MGVSEIEKAKIRKRGSTLLSVIIPVYNTSTFLVKCLNSVINQTFKDLQIILIDDGSTDESGKICDDYSQKDARIQVVHQENQGLSKARNIGLALAKGEYITFIDSDDYIELDTYSVVDEAIKKYQYPDVIFFREKSVDSKGKTVYIQGETPSGEIIKADYAFAEKRIIGELVNGVCDKVFKAEIIHGISFEIGKMYGEDFRFNLEMLKRVNTVVYIDQIKYSYVMNSDSITHRAFNENSFDQVYFKDSVVEIVKKEYPKYLKVSEKRAFLARLRICRPIYYENLERQYYEQLYIYNQYMKLHYNLVKQEMTFKEKIEYILYMYFKPLYRLFLIVVYKYRK